MTKLADIQLPIGILGGTFDPIHLGHLHLATKVYQLCNLQKVLLIPCQQSPLRSLPSACAKDRFNMAQLATQNLPFLSVEDYEIRRPTVSYSVETLEYLHKKYNNTPLSVIMGVDAFNRFSEWHEWRKILDLAHLIVADRNSYAQNTNEEMAKMLAVRQVFTAQELQKKTSGLIYFADIEPLPIAATEFRKLIKEQKDVSHLVSKDVWQYICNNNLYTDKIEQPL